MFKLGVTDNKMITTTEAATSTSVISKPLNSELFNCFTFN
ncbi:hypothetical protein SP38_263 [Salmonella phage 38]|uniref:Uncharacterized protein n=1 Tax=Salmonella phage 38 TaxID=1654891 RepID=A0A0N7CF64_9CAUD|nr:hypothetical protein SP38_263 [Salmonella phage 38]AKJ73865.1 hypothetical protein SP38_263 [Salmonella phage 38]